MFAGGKVPERRNLYYFPTIIDIKNHVLLAISAIEKGELEAVVPLTVSHLVTYGAAVMYHLGISQGKGPQLSC